ncbi:hypothetical protein AAFC00_001092 [Neodothiora populina]|uniref:Uncharacterized protein n=1 Tax=Neodothiora populina TaxID=2781224 RepID=A0ABR3PMT8_9PEZI
MPGTRSSARLADMPGSPSAENNSGNGIKRKAESSPATGAAKKGKTGEKHQTTIDDTMTDVTQMQAMHGGDTGSDANKSAAEAGNAGHENGPSCWFWVDNEAYDAYNEKDKDAQDQKKNIRPGESFEGTTKEGEDKSDPEKSLKDSRGGGGLNTMDVDKPVKNDAPEDDIHNDPSTKPASTTESGAVETSDERAAAMPSNILEKGIIYFFTRGRVGIEDPGSVLDLQRSHFVLRPLAPGAALKDGTIDDIKNNRLLALPKKVWPKGPQDKFMVFVEKGKTSMEDLKENFFQGSEYDTKTVGTRQTPPVTPIAEGVYAITKAGNRDETHLSYMVTIPRDPGEMQEDIGIGSKGSFVLSLKNPTVKGPAYTSLDAGPGFPQEFIDEFHGRSWMPVEPKHLDYPNAQILLIGESFNSSHALDATSKDDKADDKSTPAEELQKLEDEDELRVEHLKGDDSIFEDLHISSKEYPSVPTTW